MASCVNCPQFGKHAFCNLGQESRAFLEASSITMEYARGSLFFHEGDRCESIFVVCSGRVKLTATSKEGRSMILRIADAGDILGVSAALSGSDYEVTAEALEPCRVRVLQVKFLKHMLQQFGDASMGVAKALAEDYRAAFDEAKLIGLSVSPTGRIARLILDWSAEAMRKNSRTFVTMSLTHDEVASMTATTRETVTRTLSRFRKEELIQVRGVSLTVLKPATLERLSAC
jgi:CRP/FNR family cyclic AMP-dependent transcriptional regulator